MEWALLALLYALQPVAGDGHTMPPVVHRAGAQGGARALHRGFPFPVMPGWIERNTIHASGPPGHVRTSTWIHDGDPVSQAIAYRHALQAAGYRVAPGTLAGSAEVALTGSGTVAGRRYRFIVDFARGPGGDRTVVLTFEPCSLAC